MFYSIAWFKSAFGTRRCREPRALSVVRNSARWMPCCAGMAVSSGGIQELRLRCPSPWHSSRHRGARQRYAEEMPTTAYRHRSRWTRKKRFPRHSWALPAEYLGKRRLSLWAVTDLRRTASCCQGAHNSLRFSGLRSLEACWPVETFKKKKHPSSLYPHGNLGQCRAPGIGRMAPGAVAGFDTHSQKGYFASRCILGHMKGMFCGGGAQIHVSYHADKYRGNIKGSVNAALLSESESFMFLNQGQARHIYVL